MATASNSSTIEMMKRVDGQGPGSRRAASHIPGTASHPLLVAAAKAI